MNQGLVLVTLFYYGTLGGGASGTDAFLLLDGTNFLLLDGSNFLLFGV